MQIPIVVRDYQFSLETVSKWNSVWNSICEMCYKDGTKQEEIITRPGHIEVDDEFVPIATEKQHSDFYKRRYCINDELLTLDETWKEYSKLSGPEFTPSVVPELKALHVPMHLYHTLGVNAWFSECFPNCKVTFWEM